MWLIILIGKLQPVTSWLSEPANHFLVAFVLASLVLLLTLTIYYVLLTKVSPSGLFVTSMAARYDMLTFLLLVALSVALLSHSTLDSFSSWYYTPLNTPLTIIK